MYIVGDTASARRQMEGVIRKSCFGSRRCPDFRRCGLLRNAGVMATEHVVLDHLAVAVHTGGDAWPMYRDRLGGRWAGIAGVADGFEFGQLEYAGGMKIEVLNPTLDGGDFLRRFLQHTGPGPHHMTFKVPDLTVMLDRCDAMGYRTVGVYRENPGWQEAFLHPKDGAGVVIQLAQQGSGDGEDDGIVDPVPQHWPGNPEIPQSRFLYVAHAVTEFDSHVRRFVELLDGKIDGHGVDEDLDAETLDLVWPNHARIRLLKASTAKSPLVEWLGDRVGRIHHAMYTDVSGFTGEITPEENLGLRILVK
jgi:hypothetical protein